MVRGEGELKEQKSSLPPAPFVPSAHLSSVYLHLRVERKIKKKPRCIINKAKEKINKLSECCSPRLVASVITLAGGVGNKGSLARVTRSTGRQTDGFPLPHNRLRGSETAVQDKAGTQRKLQSNLKWYFHKMEHVQRRIKNPVLGH